MYQPADAALIRAASYPLDLRLPAWPDLTDDGGPEAWLEWLRQAWDLPGFSSAVYLAAPDFAGQVGRALHGEPPADGKLRRLTETTVKYLLRWTTRATPFGLFAGTAPAALGPHAAASWGDNHQVPSEPDDEPESDQSLCDTEVMTNPLGYPRGGKWVLPCARVEAGRVLDAEAALSGPVRFALDMARTPIAFRDLAEKTGPADPDAAGRLLDALVRERLLLSGARPPMTAASPALAGLRVDCEVTIPPAVTRTACDAATALAAVAPPAPAWESYRAAFTERWGPGAAVPLREVLRVLGYPAGYLGSSRRVPAAWTARDAVLAALAQESALAGGAEVILDDDLIRDLRGDDSRPEAPHTELRFALAAGTLRDLDRGAFTLTAVSGARHAGVSAGRFLHLLDPGELERFRRAYAALPTALPGADTVQIAAPPLEERLTDLARAPQMFPLMPAGDFCPDPGMTLDDLAVAGDGERLWLTSLSTGRPVEPVLLNAVLLDRLQHPVTRFLAEIWLAFSAAPGRFDWGTSSGLPFLPRVRRGRSILSPARWVVSAAEFPRRDGWPSWRAEWERTRARLRMPREVLLGDGDERLRLDLDEPAHLAVLRACLRRHEHAVLTEAPGPAGWLGGRPAEILLTLAARQPRHEPRRRARLATTACRRPGQSEWTEARLAGPRPDDILARLAGEPGDEWELPDGWWFIRYPDPEPHLRVRIRLRTPASFANAARALARWADQMAAEGLLDDCSLHPYRPETRHGSGPVLTAAEAVFAADSAAAVRALSRPDRQAATAAGMLAIADGFTGGHGAEWLARTPRRSGPRIDPDQLARAREPYGDGTLAGSLHAYRDLIGIDALNPGQVLADLLHLHHARMIGPDTASERHCLRLARAVAVADLAQAVTR